MSVMSILVSSPNTETAAFFCSQAEMVHSAFQAQRAFLLMASQYQQPQEVRGHHNKQVCLGRWQGETSKEPEASFPSVLPLSRP